MHLQRRGGGAAAGANTVRLGRLADLTEADAEEGSSRQGLEPVGEPGTGIATGDSLGFFMTGVGGRR